MSKSVATVSARLGRLPEFAGGGVVLRAVRGGRTVASKTFRLSAPKAGTRSFRWTLPKGARVRGTKVVAAATLSVAGSRSGTLRRT